MVRILLAGVSHPQCSFSTIELPHETEIRPDDIIIFSPDRWPDLKRLFENSIATRGLVISPLESRIANEILEINGQIKALDSTQLQDGLDEVIQKHFDIKPDPISLLSHIPVPILIFDLREFFSFVNRLEVPDYSDIENFLMAHPEIIEEAASHLKLISVNRMAVELYEADFDQEVIDYLNRVFHTYENHSTIKLISAIKEGRYKDYHVITKIKTLKGNTRVVKVNWLNSDFVPHFAPTVLIDITYDRTQFEKIVESQRNYYHFFEDSPVAITIANSKGEIIFANRAFSEMLGYSREEILGHQFSEYTHPDFVGENLQYLDDLMKNRVNAFQFAKKYIRKSGEEIWVLIKVKKISEPIRGGYATMALIEDITDQKIIEELLEKEYGKFQSIFENAPIAMVDLEIIRNGDIKFRMNYLNRSAYEIFLIPNMMEKRDQIWDLIAKGYPILLAQLEASISAKTPNPERESFSFSFNVTINGEQFRVVANHLPSISSSQLILFFYNVTSEFQAIHEYQSLSLLSELLQKSSDYSPFFSTSLRFLAEVFDASVCVFNSLDGQTHVLKSVVTSDERGLFEYIAKGGENQVIPLFSSINSLTPLISLQTSDVNSVLGSVLAEIVTMPVQSIHCSTLSLDYGREWIVVLLTHRIPQNPTLFQRRLENMLDIMRLSFNKLNILETLRDELKRREEIEVKLLQQTDQLSQLNQDLEQFVYAASHDLQEPLRTISSYLDLIRMKFSTDSNSEANSYLETVIAASKRLKRLITDLRNYSMIGREQLDFSNHPLTIVLLAAIKNIHHQIETTNAQVNIDVSGEIEIFGNFSLLVTLFQNLISNGLKFNKAKIPTVSIDCQIFSDSIQVNVADNGIGIEEENFSKIFQAFTRLHGQSRFKGIGMGLAICLKIVQVHNGRIDVESGSKGTTFKVILPKKPRS